MYRVEDKFLCDRKELYVLQQRLNGILQNDHIRNEDGYIITSVYFDDVFDTHLRDTVEGHYKREKYRIRIYNHSFDVIKLEVKFKEKNRIKKISKTISKEDMFRLLRGECIEEENDSLESAVTLFNLAIKCRALKPKVIVEYDRRAFIHEMGNVRITLDRGLRYSKQVTLFGKEKIEYYHTKEWQNVLEVKYDEFLPEFIAQMVEMGNLRQNSFSKYQICRQEMGEM